MTQVTEKVGPLLIDCYVGKDRNDEAALAKWVLPIEVGGRKLKPIQDKITFKAVAVKYPVEVLSPELKVMAKQPAFVLSY